MLIMGDIDRADVNDVYSSMDKALPKKYTDEEFKKYTDEELSPEGLEVYRVISLAISNKAEAIKAGSMQHYIDMVNRIDPSEEIISKKAFVAACKKKLSDTTTMMLSVACKFDSDISEAFEAGNSDIRKFNGQIVCDLKSGSDEDTHKLIFKGGVVAVFMTDELGITACFVLNMFNLMPWVH
jgi:hypothetical protein